MIQVKNRRVIATLARKTLRANRARNRIAIAAILLTTLLFAALFTMLLSINAAFQDANFRQAGGFAHGTFKGLTPQQFAALKSAPAIKELGVRRVLGMPTEAPFQKDHVEIGYSDANQARWMYCQPVEGRLPKPGSNEAATDTRVLARLGIDPKPGTPFTLTFQVDGRATTQTFILSGWWRYDEGIVASHVLIPESRLDAVLAEVGVSPETSSDYAGRWNMDVMFAHPWQIEKKMRAVLAQGGFQDQSPAAEGYVATGINWGYTGAQWHKHMDVGGIAALIALLALIVFTGYLIIYNVFRISVVNDIRFYGLLKTIGTTPRQLRRIIRRQALALSLVGIPLGLVLGWAVGARLVPVVARRLNGLSDGVISADPRIFLFAALFSLGTVLFASARPGRLAGRVSLVEALRYTEGGSRARKRKGSGGVSLWRMALANLGRSPGKTVVTVLSLALSVLMLTLTVTFTKGFDMEKYLARHVVSDFVLADAAYFQVRNQEDFLSPQAIAAVKAQGGITAGGLVYANSGLIREQVTEAYQRKRLAGRHSRETVDAMLAAAERSDDGRLFSDVDLYGMGAFPLDRLTVVAGDLAPLYEEGSEAIAAVYQADDYGKPLADSHWAKVGDRVTLTYADQYERRSAEGADPEAAPAIQVLAARPVTYTVVAEVTVPRALGHRYSANDRFVLNEGRLLADDPAARILLYAFNVGDAAAYKAMAAFLSDYTERQNAACDFESRADYVAAFERFRDMFLLLGSALSFVIGLVGVLNFFNVVLTGILARRQELAVLQAIGMTGKQLKTMLIYEGLTYALSALALSLFLTVTAAPLLAHVLARLFWFYSYRLTLAPILWLLPVFLLMGVGIPLLSHRSIAKETPVERLRKAA